MFGSVFGLGFAIEGFSFFLEAIFIGIYVYGWSRLSPRAHFLSGIPIVLAGFTGSLMVIAVNGWMNHPTGFRLVDGKAVDVAPVRRALREPLLLARAGAHVPRRLHGHRLPRRRRAMRSARLRGRWGRYERIALVDPADRRGARLRRRRSPSATGPAAVVASRPADEARRVRGPRHTDEGRAGAHPRLVHGRRGGVRDPDPAAALAARLPRPQRDRAGARHACRPTTGRR